MFEACGARRFGDIDVPKIFLVRYQHQNITVEEAIKEANKQRRARNLWAALQDDTENIASQLVSKYNGSEEVSEVPSLFAILVMFVPYWRAIYFILLSLQIMAAVILWLRLWGWLQLQIVTWISQMVYEGDNENLPNFVSWVQPFYKETSSQTRNHSNMTSNSIIVFVKSDTCDPVALGNAERKYAKTCTWGEKATLGGTNPGVLVGRPWEVGKWEAASCCSDWLLKRPQDVASSLLSYLIFWCSVLYPFTKLYSPPSTGSSSCFLQLFLNASLLHGKRTHIYAIDSRKIETKFHEQFYTFAWSSVLILKLFFDLNKKFFTLSWFPLLWERKFLDTHETYFAWITGKTSWGRGFSRWGSKPWQEEGTCAGEAIWPNRWFYESGRASEEEGGSNLRGMSNLKYFLAFCKSIYDTTPWAGTAINIWHMNMCKCWLVSTCRNRHLFPKQ